MSSKSAEEAAAALARGKRRPRASLAARLTAWYTAAAFLLVSLTGAVLYAVVERLLDHEDDQYLGEKVTIVKAFLRERPGDRAALREVVERQSASRSTPALFIRVTGRADPIETPGMSRTLPADLLQGLPARLVGSGRGADVSALSGRSFRVMVDRVAGGSSDGVATIFVALDRGGENDVLAGYRRALWLVLALGLASSAAAGRVIARRGTRPIDEMAAVASRIRATTLGERIDPADFPRELSVLAATFNAMLERLENAFSRLSRVSAEVAHQLRTPIQNLRGEAEVALGRPRSTEEYREVLASSLEECVRLSRLIDHLLFLARAENPETTITREKLDLSRELETVREFYEPAGGDLGVRLEMEAPGGLTADLDRVLLQTAVGNLIENALAHTPPGGSVRLEASGDEEEVRIRVSDTGGGIPPGDLEHVFDMFYRREATSQERKSGAGLGLPIVKSIVALHGGSVGIESEVGRGTRVTLRLPR